MSKTYKAKSFSFRRLIFNDKYLAVISLFLAIVIWIVASLNVGTNESKTIRFTVPIALNDAVSDQLGMQYYSLQDSIELSVTVSAQKYVIGQITDKDLHVSFDTSSVSKTGEQTIPIIVTRATKTLDFNVSSTYPSSIQGFFDINTSKVMPVHIDYDKNSVPDGYIFGEPVLSESKVNISGPKSYIDNLKTVQVNVDFDESQDFENEIYSNKHELEFIGSGIESSYLTVTSVEDDKKIIDNVSVKIPILKKTTLPVNVEFENKPEIFKANEMYVDYSVDTLDVGVLDSAGLTSASVGKINFNELTVGENHFEFSTNKLSGIEVFDDTEKIQTTVTIGDYYSQKNISLNPKHINVEGVPDGYRADIKNILPLRVDFVTPKTVILTESDFSMSCNVSEKSENNEYPVTIIIDDNSSWIYGKYTATIELVKI